MKAYTVIQKLRTATAEVSAAEAARLLAGARDEFAALPPNEQAEAVGQVLAFLDFGSPAPATLHNRLDHLVPLLKRLNAGNLVPQLEKLSPQVLDNLPGTRSSAPLYKTLRILWKFLETDKPFPEILQFYRKSDMASHYFLSRDDYGHLTRFFHQHANEDQVIWFYLASILGLRKIELKKLHLIDVWLENNNLTAFVLGKGEKRRQVSTQIPSWIRARIQAFIRTQVQTTELDSSAPFFHSKKIMNRKMQAILEETSLPISPHDLRRYRANLARAQDEHILEGIGKLGHSTSQTAMTSYVTVLPLLQAEYLQSEYIEHWAQSFPAGITANSLARSMAVSREAIRQYKSKMRIKAGQLSLEEAIEVVTYRIRIVNNEPLTQSRSMTRIKSS